MYNNFIQELLVQNQQSASFLDKKNIERITDDIFHFLFQLEDKKYLSQHAIELRLERIKSSLVEVIFSATQEATLSKELAHEFFEALPQLYFDLQQDAQAIYDNDPAATSIQEVYIAYPGFYAIAIYRLAHQLHLQGVNLIPRIWTEYAHGKTGIDIHPGATIDSHFCIDHGTGIVIGQTCIIGKHVKIYQGVTLGAISVSKDIANTQRHPIIEDHVIIYSGATILGGLTVIGEHSIIGGNVWLTKSVSAHSTVYTKTKSYCKQSIEQSQNPINFSI